MITALIGFFLPTKVIAVNEEEKQGSVSIQLCISQWSRAQINRSYRGKNETAVSSLLSIINQIVFQLF